MTTSVEYNAKVNERLAVDAKDEQEEAQASIRRYMEMAEAYKCSELEYDAFSKPYEERRRRAHGDYEAACVKARTIRDAYMEIISTEMDADERLQNKRSIRDAQYKEMTRFHDEMVKAKEKLEDKRAVVMAEVAKTVSVDIVDADSLRMTLKAHGISIGKGEDLEQVQKPLKNDITIYRRSQRSIFSNRGEDNDVSYFAVYGGKIVSYQMSRRSQHAGDSSDYKAFFGHKLMAQCCKTRGFGVQFLQWKDVLKEFDPKYLVPFDLDDPKNRELLGARYTWFYPQTERD